MENIRDFIIDNQIEAMEIADGFDEAFLGVMYDSGVPIAVYSYDMCVQILMRDNKLSHDDAVETFEFNTVGARIPHGPVFVHLSEHLFQKVQTSKISHLIPLFSGKIADCPPNAPQPIQDWLGL